MGDDKEKKHGHEEHGHEEHGHHHQGHGQHGSHHEHGSHEHHKHNYDQEHTHESSACKQSGKYMVAVMIGVLAGLGLGMITMLLAMRGGLGSQQNLPGFIRRSLDTGEHRISSP